MSKSATFSEDRKHRYVLTRSWAPDPFGVSRFVCIGLNPSVADEEAEDRTVERCMGHAMDNGCNELIMLNLYAFVHTQPKVMRQQPPHVAIGPDNNDHIKRTLALPDISAVVCMWGNINKVEQRRMVDVVGMIWDAGHDPWCFGTTKSGLPKHPARLAKSLSLERWKGWQRPNIPDAPFDIPTVQQVRKLPPIFLRRRRSAEAIGRHRSENSMPRIREHAPVCPLCERSLAAPRYTHKVYPSPTETGYWTACQFCGQPSEGYRWSVPKHRPVLIDRS